VGARFASLYLYDAERNRLVLKNHNHGRPIDEFVDLGQAERSLMALAIGKRKVLLIPDLGSLDDDAERLERPNRERYQTSSCTVAPLVAAGEVLGVLNLADPFDGRAFATRGDLELVESVADLLALSVHNASLFEELQSISRLDPLTGVLAPQAFLQTAVIEVKRAQRYGNDLAIVLCDLDAFHLLNANHGRRAGDGVLAMTARILRGNLREVDIVGRSGGDEFALLLPEQDVRGAMVVATRIEKLIERTHFDVDEQAFAVKATLGVAQLRKGEDAPALLRAAGELCRSAARRGERIGCRR
jgi:diguanylate cyclase (GGDEF)-like protein